MFPSNPSNRARIHRQKPPFPARKLPLEKIALSSRETIHHQLSLRDNTRHEGQPTASHTPLLKPNGKDALLANSHLPNNLSEGILVRDYEDRQQTPRMQPNNSWVGGSQKNSSPEHKMLAGVSTQNYFSLITLIREEIQRLIDEFALPAADIHRMVTYKQLFEWLMTTTRGLLEGTSPGRSAPLSASMSAMLTGRHRRVNSDAQILENECRLLRETNRLLMQSEATTKLKLQEVKNEWRVACQKMKILHGIMDGRSHRVPQRSSRLNRNLSFVIPRNQTSSEPLELKTSHSQKLITRESTSGDQLVAMELAAKVDQLTSELEQRNQRIAELEQQLRRKAKQIECIEKEFELITDKLKYLEGFKSERAVLYEQELLDQIRRLSNQPKVFGRKQVKRGNLSEYISLRQQVGVPQSTNPQTPEDVVQQSPLNSPRKPGDSIVIPRLTFNAKQPPQQPFFRVQPTKIPTNSILTKP